MGLERLEIHMQNSEVGTISNYAQKLTQNGSYT